MCIRDRYRDFCQVLRKLIEMKKRGYLIHVDERVMEMMIENEDYVVNLSWRCEPGAWITLDSDGTVFFCDDFQPERYRKKFSIFDYGEKWTWDEFVEISQREVERCAGCFWTTHVMASLYWGKELENCLRVIHYFNERK
mgnify:CR=1 FL=1